MAEGEGIGFLLSAFLSCSGAFPRDILRRAPGPGGRGPARLTAGAGVKQEMQGATLSLDLGVDGLHAAGSRFRLDGSPHDEGDIHPARGR